MKVEINFETVQKLSTGDCIEITGIVGEKKTEIGFFIAEKPKFKCCLDHRYGWDVFVFNKGVSDIQSGTIFTSLEFNPSAQFTLTFSILTESILTILNEKELHNTDQFTSVNEITSIKISGDSLIKHISFSDYSNKSSRVLQPVIYQSLKLSGEEKGDYVTVMESRQRIVFKLQNDELDSFLTSEYDSDSDLDISESPDFQTDFNYLKTILLSKKSTDNDDFLSHYTNDVPPNKYIISYFDPELNDISNYKSPNYNYSNFPLQYEFLEIMNENLQQTNSKLISLKSKTEEIEKHIENTCRDIENTRLSTNSEPNDDLGPKTTKVLTIPVRKMDGSIYKCNITRKLSNCSKIPVLVKQNCNEIEKKIEIVNTQTIPKTKINSPKKQNSSNRRRKIQIAKK